MHVRPWTVQVSSKSTELDISNKTVWDFYNTVMIYNYLERDYLGNKFYIRAAKNPGLIARGK